MSDTPGPDAMVCRELVELVTDYLEGALPPAARASIEAHLAECPPCCEYVEQIRRTVRALGGLQLPPGPEERSRLLALFRRWRERPAG